MSSLQEKQFTEWYEAHADAIFRYVYFRLNSRDREQALEIVQEVFLRTWEYCQKKEVENIRAFLYRIATNILIDESRKPKVAVYSLEELKEASGFDPPADDPPADQLENKLAMEKVKKVLERLEPGDRELITFRYLEDLEPKEIAKIINQSANVVSVRLNRAVKKLKAILQET